MTGWLFNLAAFACIGAVGFGFGYHRADLAHAKTEAEWQAKYDAQVQATAQVQGRWNEARIYGDKERARADTAIADADALADRLSNYRTARCTVPRPAEPAGGSGSRAPEPGKLEALEREIERLEKANRVDCAADATDFAFIRNLYNSMRAAQCAASPASC